MKLLLFTVVLCACDQDRPAPAADPPGKAFVESALAGMKRDCDVRKDFAVSLTDTRSDGAALIGSLASAVQGALELAGKEHRHAVAIVTSDEAIAGAKALVADATAASKPFNACRDASAQRATELCNEADAVFDKLIQGKRTLMSELDPKGLPADIYDSLQYSAKAVEVGATVLHRAAAERPAYCR